MFIYTYTPICGGDHLGLVDTFTFTALTTWPPTDTYPAGKLRVMYAGM